MGVNVQFRLPPTYPDEVPEVTIVTATGLESGEMREMEKSISQQVRTANYLMWCFCNVIMCDVM